MEGEYYWVRPAPGDEWEPGKDDGDGYFLVIGHEMPGKPSEVGPKIEKREQENDMGDNTDDLREEAIAALAHVKSHALGDDMTCLTCGKSVPIRRTADGTSWDVECGCGWGCAGSGPPTRPN